MYALHPQEKLLPASRPQPHALFCLARYWPSMGGAELHTREMVKRLCRRGRVGVVHHCTEETHPPEVAFAYSATSSREESGIPVDQLGAQGAHRPLLQLLGHFYPHTRWVRPLYTALFKATVREKLEHIAADYSLIHAVYNGLTPCVELVAEVCDSLVIPFVWTPLAHTTLPHGTGWSSRSFRRLYRRADALIAMTAFEQEWLIDQGACAERVHVCPVAPLLAETADPQQFRAAHGLSEVPMVLFLGRLVDYKGYKQLCEAAKIVWESYPETCFVFIGPVTPEAQQWFAVHQDRRFLVLGLLSDYNKTSALAACDVLCVPSTEESLGVAYLEAWSFAKPVIAVEIPVLKTVITHGVDGVLIQQNGSAIAQALVDLLRHPEVRQAMGQRGAQKVAEQYDWNVLAQRMSDIYAIVMQRHKSGTNT
jgi:glycosyltransferase involved in cell wall biosynthesis